MARTLIQNAVIVNENQTFQGDVLIEDDIILEVKEGNIDEEADEYIDATGLVLIPGVIDDQVHFREPGFTHKAEIATESRAAVAGGVTSYMEMPNTNPQAVTIEELEKKYRRAADVSPANYSFFMGATNDNVEEIKKVDPKKICGVKIFMGSSTGNMLVDNQDALIEIFKHSPTIIATHCEDEETIRQNSAKAKEEFGEDVPFEQHPIIRNAEACFLSSSMAIKLAEEHDARLHILHISTDIETSLFRNDIPLKEKKITSEVCVHHMWFSDEDYAEKGSLIKCNPAIKTGQDRAALLEALKDGNLDIIATDHAPHTMEEKNNKYFSAPSGLPLVQHSLVAMLDFVNRKEITLEFMVEKMCHAPAELFEIEKRGFIREGYYADLVLVDLNTPSIPNSENILYKCGWSPFEGHEFVSSVHTTLVNGEVVFSDGELTGAQPGMRLTFDR
jgi:dihydroorotase